MALWEHCDSSIDAVQQLSTLPAVLATTEFSLVEYHLSQDPLKMYCT
ncbi:hypothetical protein APHCRT_1272 [Anaplasma phagocytophilum str. CRT53-1]|uniref:Uncharacterized protein n=2 Tax=Anaplasma phagocytophilum TaxID=948 RepID=A0A0F3PWC1_ANAPH|nr:hypothetical protein APHWEB_0862 [Anaplasma phagocytophilum str. Webster]KJV82403.1 hypothetical protein APHHGE2_1450 [Anaplasma phagocytophilum str. HGE2]KJV83757.1 hypothetical protein APHCRT_1272 [Anaplasma phagocytophilum str. CRT53-1]KJV84181.1 hypothetical protein APHWI1_0658 [Anaplasma phagocytophilum str. ApWI1]KJV87307.1 hypothetical protein APHNYW_1167 [Anaplasma phagocytophilum str. ApNYW]KJV98003.1 hypothetical protein OTSANNIE_1428 [Anaplasma phagocytophilum str. Annie]KKA0064